MKKSIFKYLLLLVLAASIIFALASCSFVEGLLPGDDKPDDGTTDDGTTDDGTTDDGTADDGTTDDGTTDEAPDLSGIVFEDKTVTYNGEYHEIAVDETTVPGGVVVMYSTNKYMNAGSYSVTADFYFGGIKVDGATKSATLTINKASYDVSAVTITGLTKTYDGVEVEPEIAGKLPAGVSVSYVYQDADGNEVEAIVDAGTYTVFANFAGDSTNYHPISPISATVKIRKVKVSGLSFADAAFDYDGTEKSIYISGDLPEGISVSYDGNGVSETGTHTVTASFTVNGNYDDIAPMSATITIAKRAHDMAAVALLGKTATYTGESQMITVEGTLPEGVSVEYIITDAAGNEVADIVNVGVYTVVARFTGNPYYEAIADMSATVTVTKATVSAVQFSDAQFYYDGAAKTVSIEGVLPEGASVLYVITDESGATVSEILRYGVYTVVARFTLGENYEPIEDMTATVTVIRRAYDMSGVSFPSASHTYDGTSKDIAVVGTLPEGVSVEYVITDESGATVDEIINAGEYTVTAIFAGDPYMAPIDNMTATVTVAKATVSGIEFADARFAYDGAEKSVLVTGLPPFVTVEYTGNGNVNPGTYTVTATFITGDNVEPIAPMSATMKIEIANPLDNPTQTIVYKEVEDGYEVTGVTDSPAILIIPATHEGKSVVSIASNAFRDMDLAYVYIPESVKSIGNAAFYNNTSLTTLEIADFSVTVGDDGELVTVGSSALTIIGQKAFANTAITAVDLPDGIVAMGYGVFEGCDSITKMTVPFVGGSSATGHAYLGYLFGAKSAETASENVPAALKEVIISDNCTEIPARAFMRLGSIERIYIGRSVTKIGINAFAGCTGISDIYIPVSVTTIPAIASAAASPFLGCSEELLIVVESSASAASFGKYYAAVSDGGAALAVFNKTYEDYVMNKDNYRVPDPADSKAAGIYVGGAIIDGFDPRTLTYTAAADINTGYGIISAIAASSTAEVVVTQAKDGVAKVVITSGNGMSITTYTINFVIEGTFNSSASVVGKDGTKGTVSFVIDDGYVPAANFSKTMLEKYPNLALNFAVPTRHFATLTTQDTDGDGIQEYVMDTEGNYTYTVNEEKLAFWRDILSATPGRAEILPHSHNHGFWGMNDEGGTQVTVSDRNHTAGATDSLIKGGSTAQIWAAQQIIEDLFGDLGSMGRTFVTPGIVKHTGPRAIEEDCTVKFSNSPVWLVSDTAVSFANGTITLTPQPRSASSRST